MAGDETIDSIEKEFAEIKVELQGMLRDIRGYLDSQQSGNSGTLTTEKKEKDSNTE